MSAKRRFQSLLECATEQWRREKNLCPATEMHVSYAQGYRVSDNVAQHLTSCALCQADVHELTELTGILSEVMKEPPRISQSLEPATLIAKPSTEDVSVHPFLSPS